MDELLRELGDHYLASTKGYLISTKYRGREGKVGILKGNYNNKGYEYVNLFFNGKRKIMLVHRAIAMSFPEICGEWFEGCEVDHINGIRDDNRAENLRTCTTKENSSYDLCKKHKSESALKRLDCVKPVCQYAKDGQFISEYFSIGEAVRQTKISQSSISQCCRGKYSHAGGYIWKYKDGVG